MTQREQEILSYLKDRHFATISEMAKIGYVSEATVRRDIKKLEARGFLKSVYGGVVLEDYENDTVPVSMRDGENAAAKERAAVRAAALIKDHSTVILDASSTVRRICRHIKTRKGLTVITNNVRVCEELKDTSVRVYCTGGLLAERRECFVGPLAEDFMGKIKADAVFFSAQGVGEEGDITDSSEEEVSLRRAMFRAAREKVFLYDDSKKNREYPFFLTNLRDVTYVIEEM